MGKSRKKHVSKSQKDVSGGESHKGKSKNKVERADSEDNANKNFSLLSLHVRAKQNRFEATLKKRKKLGKAESKECLKTRANLKKHKKHALDVERVMSFKDLPLDLIGEKILSNVPITSLGSVRCTCKLLNALSKEWMLSKAPTSKRQSLSFIMTMDYKIYSLRITPRSKDICNRLVLSRMHVAILDQVKIAKVFHCDGLLLCVLKDKSRLVVWNPYSGETRWITNFHKCDMYALGYDKNRNHKILTFSDDYDVINEKHSFMVEIYDFRSHSWRVLDVTWDWAIDYDAKGGVSLKGNTYFFAQEEIPQAGDDGSRAVFDFLVCLDFTNERFGPRLTLPFQSNFQEGVTLSCVGEEQLAVLYQRLYTSGTYEFWKTTKIEPDVVSWRRFLKVEMTPRIGYLSEVVSFFIDVEEKVAVVLNGDRDEPSETSGYHDAFIVGDGGYFKSVNLGECPTVSRPPLLCSSSYLPSLVKIN